MFRCEIKKRERKEKIRIGETTIWNKSFFSQEISFLGWTNFFDPDTFYKAHCIYFFNCIAQNKFIYGPTWTKKEKNSSIFHDYYWLHYTPEEEDGVLNFDDRECMFACIADCSYVVTSLAPSTLQFRVERKETENREWQSRNEWATKIPIVPRKISFSFFIDIP